MNKPLLSCWLMLGLCACGGGAGPAAGPATMASNPVVSPSAGSPASSGQSAGSGSTTAAGASAAGSGPAASGPTAGKTSPTAAGSSAPAAGSGAAPSAGNGSAPVAGAAGTGSTAAPSEPFSFFVTSHAAIQRLSKTPNGFGGDLRYGQADGLAGADKICTEIADTSLPGSGKKGWRAFLSITKGPDGKPVHAIDRVGNGPWYDRLGRLLAMTRADLLNPRPKGADPAIANDFPNEDGVPNHAPDGTKQVDNHDMLTGTNDKGQLFNTDWRYTCHDWTSAVGMDGTPRVGHSWPRTGGGGPGGGFPTGGRGGGPTGGPGGFPIGGNGSFAPPGGGGPIDTVNWMSSLNEAGCAPGASLVEMGPPNPQNPTVGSGGGYGGFYCFALTP